MLWVLKRTISMRLFFEHPKHMLKIIGKYIKYIENIYNFRLKFFVYLNIRVYKELTFCACIFGNFTCAFYCLLNFFSIVTFFKTIF